jgi:hypothetical protein
LSDRAVRKDAIWTPEHIDEMVVGKTEKALEKALA